MTTRSFMGTLNHDVIFPVLPDPSVEIATMISTPPSREECFTVGKFKNTAFELISFSKDTCWYGKSPYQELTSVCRPQPLPSSSMYKLEHAATLIVPS